MPTLNPQQPLRINHAVTRSGRTLSLVCTAVAMENEGTLRLGEVSARDISTGHPVELTPEEQQWVIRQCQAGWVDGSFIATAALTSALLLADRLVRDPYNAEHATKRDAAVARRADGNKLARLLRAIHNQALSGAGVPKQWTARAQPPRPGQGEPLTLALAHIHETTETLKSLRGTHFSTLAQAGSNILRTQGFSPAAARTRAR